MASKTIGLSGHLRLPSTTHDETDGTVETVIKRSWSCKESEGIPSDPWYTWAESIGIPPVGCGRRRKGTIPKPLQGGKHWN